MSYQVFSRKYRPQAFSDLIGQPHIKETLMNAITTNRLAHAYLFAGSRGTGKTTTARILAKCLNCFEGISPTPCNICSSCKEIKDGYSMDVIEIDGASNRGIDEIRELRERVKFLPANARYKVYIIDEVHMLTNEAFNALLKTLEEPPSHVIFVFATTEPHKVPQTILSRCQRFDFRRIPVTEISNLLKKVADEEKIEIDDLSLPLIARAAEGSMRDAESLLDQVVSYCGNKVTQKDVLTILGIVKQEILINFCQAIINADVHKIINLLNDLIDEGIDLIQFVREMMIHLRNLLLIKAGCSSDSVIDLASDSIKLLETQASQWTQKDLLTMIEELQKANENMRLFPLQARLILEVTLIKVIEQKTEDRNVGQASCLPSQTEDRRQRIEDRGQRTQDSEQMTEDRIQTPDTRHQTPDTRHQTPDTRHQAPGTRHQTPDTRHQTPDTRHQAPGTRHQAPDTRHQTLDTRHQTLDTRHQTPDIRLSLQQIKEIWADLRKNIKKEKPSLEHHFAGAELLDITNHILTIGFKKEDLFHRERIEKRENKEFIEAQIKQMLNCDLRIKTVFMDNESSVQEGTTSKIKILDMALKVFPEAKVIT